MNPLFTEYLANEKVKHHNEEVKNLHQYKQWKAGHPTRFGFIKIQRNLLNWISLQVGEISQIKENSWLVNLLSFLKKPKQEECVEC